MSCCGRNVACCCHWNGSSNRCPTLAARCHASCQHLALDISTVNHCRQTMCVCMWVCMSVGQCSSDQKQETKHQPHQHQTRGVASSPHETSICCHVSKIAKCFRARLFLACMCACASDCRYVSKTRAVEGEKQNSRNEVFSRFDLPRAPASDWVPWHTTRHNVAQNDAGELGQQWTRVPRYFG